MSRVLSHIVMEAEAYLGVFLLFHAALDGFDHLTQGHLLLFPFFLVLIHHMKGYQELLRCDRRWLKKHMRPEMTMIRMIYAVRFVPCCEGVDE